MAIPYVLDAKATYVLYAFLYTLMRDDVTTGRIHQLIDEIVLSSGDYPSCSFTNANLLRDVEVCLEAIKQRRRPREVSPTGYLYITEEKK